MRNAVILAAWASLTAGMALADWPQFGGPNRDNVATGVEIVNQWPAEGPKVLWTVPLGEGFGGAAIRDGQVYVLDRVHNQQDVLRCLDLASGKELWTFAYDAPGSTGFNGSRSVPTVSDKYVFICGPFGQLTCVDRSTHQQVWQTNVVAPGAKLPPWAIAQSPLLAENLVVTASLGGAGGLTAFEQESGKVAWKAAGVEGVAYCSPTLLEMGGKPMILQTTSKGVLAVDVKTGKPLWNFAGYSCRAPIPYAVRVGEDRLFLTGGYKAGSALIALKEADGKMTASQVWKIPQGSQIHQPIVVGDRIYLNGNSNESQDGFTALDLATGKMLWKVSEPALDRACLLYADGVFFMIDSGGTLHMARAGDSKLEELASAKLLGPKDIWAPLAISDGVLVIRDQREMKALQVGK